MPRRRRLLKIILGTLLGVFISQLFATTTLDVCPRRKTATPFQLISEENQRARNKNLLFVGIMTASKYLDTRAKAVYDTWGREIPGKVLFYSSEYSSSEHVPLIPLPEVDDRYPPQKKSFMMLKHMHDNYIEEYEWFLRADDDVYVRTDRLEELLRSVDSRKAWFIGQTGRGNSDEFGLLSLENDENFCMGGPGVIMSRETLKRVAPYVEDCLEHMYTTHEDVELGRCVRRFAGISCTWSYEMQVILYHNQSGEAAFTGDLKQKEVHRAITLHPVKQPPYIHRLHKYIKGLKIQDRLQSSLLLHRDLSASMSELGYRPDRLEAARLVKDLPLFPERSGSNGYLGDTKLLGTPTGLNRYKPVDLRDVLEWELISKNLYSHRDLNPRRRIGSSLKEGLSDVVREIMELINSYSKQRGRVIDFKEILYGYWRLDPVHGADLVLDLLLVYRKYRGHKMTVQVRRHAYVQQTFTGIFIREITDSNNTSPKPTTTLENSLPVHKKLVNQLVSKITQNLEPILNLSTPPKKQYVNLILPISGRFQVFSRFIKMYEEICIKEEEPTRLYIVLYKNQESPNDFQKTIDLTQKIQSKHGYTDIRILESNETFSRGRALQIGVNSLKEDELMVFIDVDVIFDRKSLERTRKNVVRNKKIYFPIVYSLYNPKLFNESYSKADHSIFDQNTINEDRGFWRQFGFGIVGLYKSDYLSLGGFNLTISGWGYEDVTFYDSAVKSDLNIVRVPDPGLIHVFHPVECDEHLEAQRKSMCLGTKSSTLGSVNNLQKLLIKYKDSFGIR